MKNACSKKLWPVLILSGFFLAPAGSAWARDRESGYHGGRAKGRHEVVVAGRDRYHYRNGRFYRPGWFGFEFVLSVPPVGIVVSSIPAAHRTVIVGSQTYYYYDHVYYRPCPTGYVVVPRGEYYAGHPTVDQLRVFYGK